MYGMARDVTERRRAEAEASGSPTSTPRCGG